MKKLRHKKFKYSWGMTMLGNKPDLTTEHILHTTLGMTFVSLSFTTCKWACLQYFLRLT